MFLNLLCCGIGNDRDSTSCNSCSGNTSDKSSVNASDKSSGNTSASSTNTDGLLAFNFRLLTLNSEFEKLYKLIYINSI